MDKDIADKWVDALRSGRYKQTRGRLKARNGAMCCLAVLAVVCGQKFVWDRGLYTLGGTCVGGSLREWSGNPLKTSVGAYSGALSLSAENDGGKTFDEIADIIEKHYEEL